MSRNATIHDLREDPRFQALDRRRQQEKVFHWLRVQQHLGVQKHGAAFQTQELLRRAREQIPELTAADDASFGDLAAGFLEGAVRGSPIGWVAGPIDKRISQPDPSTKNNLLGPDILAQAQSLRDSGMSESDVQAFLDGSVNFISKKERGRGLARHIVGVDKSITREFSGGAATMVGSLLGAAGYMNISRAINSQVKTLKLENQISDEAAKILEVFEWSDMLTPEYWANEAAGSLSVTIPLLLTGGGAMALAGRAGLKGLMATAVGTLTTVTPIEAALEATRVWQQVLDEGGSEEDAARAGASTFANNFAMLAVSNTLGFHIAKSTIFRRMSPDMQKSFVKWGMSKVGHRVGVATGLVGQAVIEGVEEAAFQNYYQDLGIAVGRGTADRFFEPFVQPALEFTTALLTGNLSDAQRRTLALGMASGLLFGGGAQIYGSTRNRAKSWTSEWVDIRGDLLRRKKKGEKVADEKIEFATKMIDTGRDLIARFKKDDLTDEDVSTVMEEVAQKFWKALNESRTVDDPKAAGAFDPDTVFNAETPIDTSDESGPIDNSTTAEPPPVTETIPLELQAGTLRPPTAQDFADVDFTDGNAAELNDFLAQFLPFKVVASMTPAQRLAAGNNIETLRESITTSQPELSNPRKFRRPSIIRPAAGGESGRGPKFTPPKVTPPQDEMIGPEMEKLDSPGLVSLGAVLDAATPAGESAPTGQPGLPGLGGRRSGSSASPAAAPQLPSSSTSPVTQPGLPGLEVQPDMFDASEFEVDGESAVSENHIVTAGKPGEVVLTNVEDGTERSYPTVQAAREAAQQQELDFIGTPQSLDDLEQQLRTASPDLTDADISSFRAMVEGNAALEARVSGNPISVDDYVRRAFSSAQTGVVPSDNALQKRRNLSHNPHLALEMLAGTAVAPITVDFPAKPKIIEVARFVERLAGDPIAWAKATEEQNKIVEDALYNEVLFALEKHKGAKGWYKKNLELAMKRLAAIEKNSGLPKTLHKKENQFLLKAIIAITSDGNAVQQNLNQAWDIYASWQKNGRPNLRLATGKNVDAIRDNLGELDMVVSELGLKKAVTWLTVKESVSDVRASLVRDLGMSKEEAASIGTAELASAIIPRGVLFGPKLGSFLNNLNGDFSTVTMDRWFMRTIGRITGELVEVITGQKRIDYRKRVRNALNAISKEELASLPISRTQAKGSGVEAVSKKIERYFSPKARREDLSAELNEVRLAANTLSKSLEPVRNSPDSGGHRKWMRERVEAVQKQLRAAGIQLENADVQALLWYNEKELYLALGNRPKKGADDFASAAEIVHKRVAGRPSGITAGRAGRVERIGGKTGKEGLGRAREGGPFAKDRDGQVRAEVEFDEDSRAIIRAFKGADGLDIAHELFHVFRKRLGDLANQGFPEAREMLGTLEKWAGVKKGNWTVAAEERVAEASELYLSEGKPPTEGLRDAFEHFKNWLSDIWSRISGDIKLTPEVRDVFDRLLGKAPPVAVPAAPAAPTGLESARFNFTVVTKHIELMKQMLIDGRFDDLRELNRAVMRHALADIPSRNYKLKSWDVEGVWDGTTEPSISVEISADAATMDKVRARLAAVSSMFKQEELHEIEMDVELPEGVALGGRVGFNSYQPFAVISLPRKAKWSQVEAARATSGILGASFDGTNILVYNVEETAEVFENRVAVLTETLNGNQNDTGLRGSITAQYGVARIRRYSDTQNAAKGQQGYAEASVSDASSTISDLSAELFLRIAQHTGGRLTAPEARSFFTLSDLNPDQIAHQMAIADRFGSAPVDDLSNPLVARAYEAAATAMINQWNDIIDGNIEIVIVPWERIEHGAKVIGEPYPNSAAVVNDIRQNRRLRVLQTDASSFGPEGADFTAHPFLKQATGIKAPVMGKNGVIKNQPILVNDVLRAVHDAIAHGLYADSFGPVGEEGAWRAHMATIADPWARWAITTETRGQNSFVNYGPKVRDSDGNLITSGQAGYTPIADRGFAVQKAFLLPLTDVLTGNFSIDGPVLDLIDELNDQGVDRQALSSIEVLDADVEAINNPNDAVDEILRSNSAERAADKIQALAQQVADNNPEAFGDLLSAVPTTPEFEETRALLEQQGDEIAGMQYAPVDNGRAPLRVAIATLNPEHFGRQPVAPAQAAITLGKILGQKIAIASARQKSRFAQSRGQFDPGQQVVTLTGITHIPRTAHEIAHAISALYGLDPRTGPAAAELLRLGNNGSLPPNQANPVQYTREEGLAEFIFGVMVNPDAIATIAPMMMARYTAAVKDGGVPKAIRDAIHAYGEEIRLISGLGRAEQNRLGAFAWGDERDSLGARIKKKFYGDKDAPGFQPSDFDRFAHSTTNPIAMFQSAMRDAMGAKDRTVDELLPSSNPIIGARLLAGHAGKMYDYFMNGVFDFHGKRRDGDVGRNAKDLYKWFDGLTRAQIEADVQMTATLMTAERVIDVAVLKAERKQLQAEIKSLTKTLGAAERANNGDLAELLLSEIEEAKNELAQTKDFADITSPLGLGLLPEVDAAREIIQDLEQNQPVRLERIKKAAAEYRAFSESFLTYSVEGGRMSQEAFDRIKKNNGHYVAMRREMLAYAGERLAIGGGSSKGNPTSFTNVGKVTNAVVKFTGSERAMLDPYQVLWEAGSRIVGETDRNAVWQNVVHLVLPDADTSAASKGFLSSIVRRTALDEANSIPVYFDGVKQSYVVHQDVLAEVTGYADSHIKLPMLFGLPARILKAGILNFPAFGIRQRNKDIQERAVISRTAPSLASLPGIKSFFVDFVRVWKPVDSEMVSLLLRFGGDQVHSFMKGPAEWHSMQRGISRELESDSNVVVTSFAALTKAYDNYFVSGGDRATRVIEYESAYKKAKDELGYDDYNAHLYAAFNARDLMDFSMAGEYLQVVRQWTAFGAIPAQAMRRQLRFLGEGKGATGTGDLAVKHAMLALPKLAVFGTISGLMGRALIHAIGGDAEKEYQRMSTSQRHLYNNIPLMFDGKVQWISIPRPYEVGLFAAAADLLYSDILTDEVDPWQGFVGSALHLISPVSDEMMAGPARALIEATTGYDFFRERFIIPPWDLGRPLHERGGISRASRVSKLIGDIAGFDARRLDQFIKSSLGYFGKTILDVSNIGRDDVQGFSFNPFYLTTNVVGLTKAQAESAARPVQAVFEITKNDGRIREMRQYKMMRKHMRQMFDTKKPELRQRSRERMIAAAEKLIVQYEKRYANKPPR